MNVDPSGPPHRKRALKPGRRRRAAITRETGQTVSGDR
jgi:hypothetical protein